MAYWPYLVHLARVYVGTDAEDAAQEAVVRAWEKRQTFRPGALRPWLQTITVNTCFDLLRRKRLEAEAVILTKDPGYDYLADAVVDSDLLRRALAATPAVMARVLSLAAMGYEVLEIARMLGIPPGTVCTRLLRGRRHLARYIRRCI